MALVCRTESSNIYRISPKQYRLDVGGDIANCLPFDGGDEYVEVDITKANATEISPDVWRFSGGKWGYTADLANGSVKVHPVRGDWDKWYEVAAQNPIALSVNQVSSKSVELYKDRTNVRYSMILSNKGFKINILLKDATAPVSTSFIVRYNGLTRQGKGLYDGDTLIGLLPKPWLADANGTTRNVSTSTNGDVVTLMADTSGLAFPINVDPSLSGINPTADAQIYSGFPDTNYGAEAYIQLYKNAGTATRSFLRFDVSAIPAGSTIDAATMTLNVSNWGNGGGTQTVGFYLLDEDKVSFPEANVTWNSYDDSVPTAWDTAGGDYGAVAFHTQQQATGVGTWTITDLTTGITNSMPDPRLGIFSFIMKFLTEGTALTSYVVMDSSEGATPPALSVTYTPQQAYVCGGLGGNFTLMGSGNV